MTFTGKMTLWLGKLEVQLLQLGRGHTKGDTVARLPQQKILFSGDLVEFDATPYAGDAYFRTGRPRSTNIAALKPEKLVPGRGAALTTPEQVKAGLAGTRAPSSPTCAPPSRPVSRRARISMPSTRTPTPRLAPEVRQMGHLRPLHALRRDALLRRGHAIPDPRIWTAERDRQMWAALES